ncbi:unnamed protein product, partial [Rotaria magnacalcarata]
MRQFLLVFTRRLLIPCGALLSGSVAASFSNINEQKHHSILKSIGRNFSERSMGGKEASMSPPPVDYDPFDSLRKNNFS